MVDARDFNKKYFFEVYNVNNNQKNLFSIGEIAKAIGITRKIILNYEAKGLIQPAAGNRYYTIDTFTQIRTIRAFQDLGLSLDEVREYFDGTTDLQLLIKRLENMRDELNLSIEKLRERSNENPDFIKEITIAPQTIYCRTYNSSTISEKTILLRETALEAMRAHGTDTTRCMYFIEYSMENADDISYCIAVPLESKGKYIQKIPAQRAISLYHHGAYEEIPTAREKLIAYAKENNIKISGKCRHLYVEGPPQHKDKSKFITQVILPISQ